MDCAHFSSNVLNNYTYVLGKAFEFSGVQVDSTLIPMYKGFKEGNYQSLVSINLSA